MKLNTRFSILFILISLVTISLPLLLLRGEQQILKLSQYENLLKETEIQFNKLSSFSSQILYFGCDVTSLKSDWADKKGSLVSSIVKLSKEEYLSILQENNKEEVAKIKTLWTSIQVYIQKLTSYYNSIAEFQYQDSGILNFMKRAGLLKTIDTYQNKQDLSMESFYASSIESTTRTFQTSGDVFLQIFTQVKNNIEKEIQTTNRLLYIIGIACSVSMSLIIFLISFFSTRRLVRRIKKLQDAASSLANKEVSIVCSSPSKDEVGNLSRDIDKAASILDDVLNKVKENTRTAQESGIAINSAIKETVGASGQITTNMGDLVTQLETVLAAVDTCITTLAKVRAISDNLISDNQKQTKAISENDTSVSDIASEIQNITQMAVTRSESAQEMQQYISTGDEKITATAELLNTINGQLDEVNEVIVLINKIAEQTNLLSMNAAIESAHAGDAGKGFAVVAEEIRNLSESTKENSDRITRSISGIIQQVKTADATSSEASSAFTKVREHTEMLVASLNDITSGIQNIETKSHQITIHTGELAGVASRVNEFCSDLDKHQTALSGEMDKLKNAIAESQNEISRIKIDVTDITDRIDEISELSSENSTKMQTLSTAVNEFVTTTDEVLEERTAETPVE